MHLEKTTNSKATRRFPGIPRLRRGRTPAGQAAPLGFRTSNLRGSGLARRGAGAAATALWISTEAQRLREEAQLPKPIGVSSAAAFLLNRGLLVCKRRVAIHSGQALLQLMT